MTQNPFIGSILFDLDNTLLDRDAGFARYCRWLYRASAAVNQADTEAEAVAIMLSLDADGSRARPDFMADLMRQWPGVFSDLDAALEAYITSYPRFMVLEPQTKALLEDLGERGIPWAIVTNGNAVTQMSKVRESGLEQLVKAIVISEEAGVAKPDRRIFEQALSRISADPLTTLFVGDNPDADILGAKGLGMRTAWVHRGRQWPYDERRPDHVVGHVSDVREIVFGWRP